MSIQDGDNPSRLVEILNIMNSQYPNCWETSDPDNDVHSLIFNEILAVDVEESQEDGVFAMVSVSNLDSAEGTPFKMTREISGLQSLGIVLYECIDLSHHDAVPVKLYSNGKFITDGTLVESDSDDEHKEFMCNVDEETLIELIHIFANAVC